MPRNDDFKIEVKERLAKRVGMLCSNPGCQRLTSGPATDTDKSVNIGVAAHITAASPGGARYDVSLSEKKRRDIDNGIWCCQNCAKLIDNDAERFTVALLRQWKRLAEDFARQSIEKPKNSVRGERPNPMSNVRCVLIRNSLDFDKTLDSGAHSKKTLIKIDDRELARQFRGIEAAIFHDRTMISPDDVGERMSYLDSIEEALEEMIQLDIELFCVMLPLRVKNKETGYKFDWDVANYFFIPKVLFYASSADVTKDLMVHLVADNCVEGLKIWVNHIRYHKPLEFWTVHSMFNRLEMPTFCPVCCEQLLEIRRTIEAENAGPELNS